MADNKKLILVIGDSGSGKTSSLRNMPLEKTVYIDVDRKSIKSFKGMDKLRDWVKLDYIDHLIPGLKALEADPECEYIVIDTLSFALDMFVAQKIDTAADTRAAWGQYKQWYKELIHIAKTSKKSYIFLTHAKDIYDEKAMTTKTAAYAQGSIFGIIEADFAVVAYTHKYVDEHGMPKYGFLVNPTKETLSLSAKSPMEMFDEPLIEDNDIMTIFEAIENY